jgi:hypothetical protein
LVAGFFAPQDVIPWDSITKKAPRNTASSREVAIAITPKRESNPVKSGVAASLYPKFAILWDGSETKKENTPMIMVGKKAPDFTAPGYHNGEFVNVKLSDSLGKWTLLCFYPGDFTFV